MWWSFLTDKRNGGWWRLVFDLISVIFLATVWLLFTSSLIEIKWVRLVGRLIMVVVPILTIIKIVRINNLVSVKFVTLEVIPLGGTLIDLFWGIELYSKFLFYIFLVFTLIVIFRYLFEIRQMRLVNSKLLETKKMVEASRQATLKAKNALSEDDGMTSRVIRAVANASGKYNMINGTWVSDVGLQEMITAALSEYHELMTMIELMEKGEGSC
jgi:hypothetical protein